MANKKYIIAFSVALLILIGNHIFIQYELNSMKRDAEVINDAGRQRMLSQRINLELYEVIYHNAGRSLLEEFFLQWKQNHQNLKNSELVNHVRTPETIKTKLNSLYDRIIFTETYLHADQERLKLNLASLSRNQEKFLVEMDSLVGLMEKFSGQKIARLDTIKSILFLASGVVIILEIFLIFIPIQRRLKESNKDLNAKNDELEELNKNLRKKNQQLKYFGFITSHHLREPLVTLAAYSELLYTNYSEKLDDVGQRSLKYVHEASRRMGGQIRSLLEYATVGKDEKIEHVNMRMLVDEVTETLKLQMQAGKAEIVIEELPSVMGYQAVLHVLWKNLLTNALKFQKGTIPKIHISGSESESHYTFSIADNGIGIPEKQRKKVFKMFYRLNDRHTYEGLGVGLALCERIVKLHNGKIRIEDNDGEGTVVRFTISKELS